MRLAGQRCGGWWGRVGWGNKRQPVLGKAAGWACCMICGVQGKEVEQGECQLSRVCVAGGGGGWRLHVPERTFVVKLCNIPYK